MVVNKFSKTTNLIKQFGQKIYLQFFFMVIASYTAYEITAKIFLRKMCNICV